MLEGDNEALQNFAANSLLIDSAFYSATTQMNEFYNSLTPEAL
jgi:hypothetical protein